MAYTTIDDPEAYFQVRAYTGNGSADTAITFDGDTDLEPDLLWIKRRDTTMSHLLFDAVRGITKRLLPNSTAAESTESTIASFNSDGWTMDADTANNADGGTYAAWCWKANGSGSANTAGSKDTTATSANTTSGFSISTLTTDSSGADTYGHGLGAVPSLVIAKTRSSSNGWFVYHKDVGNNKFLRMETTGAEATNTMWNDTTPTSTVFSLMSDNIGTSKNCVAYCFAELSGYSKFGSYTGNGNADGTFVYTGFKPAWFMLKKTTETEQWIIHDNKRPGYNPSNVLYANLTNAEDTGSSVYVDILSNGVKIRGTYNGLNDSGETYVFIAFAEAPFVNSNGVPCNAR